MRKLVFWIVLFFGMACLPSGAFAQTTYTDNMRDMDNNTVKYYQNLQPISTSGIPPNTKEQIGPLALTFLNPGYPVGNAIYRVQGGQTVSVEIYTWLGTFAAPIPGQAGIYAAGMPTSDMGYVRGVPLYPLLLSNTGQVHSYVNGSLHRLANTTENIFALLPAQTGEQSFMQYGLNVYAGKENSRRKIDMIREQGTVQVYGDRVYERFTGVLPADTQTVWVEINDFSKMDMQRPNGDIVSVPNPTGMRTVLSKVVFAGNRLILGEPEPASKEESLRDEESSQKEEESASKSSSSSSKASSKASSSSKKPAETPSSSKASSYTSAKFEGVIVSSSASSKGAASKSSSSKSASKWQPDAGEESPMEGSASGAASPYPAQQSVDIVRLAPTKTKNNNTAVSVYIVTMVALVFVLLMRKK